MHDIINDSSVSSLVYSSDQNNGVKTNIDEYCQKASTHGNTNIDNVHTGVTLENRFAPLSIEESVDVSKHDIYIPVNTTGYSGKQMQNQSPPRLRYATPGTVKRR